MLEIITLHKSYRNQKVLQGFNLNVPENTLLNISGPSGCGKTTLLRCIAGFEEFEKGVIKIENIIIQSADIFVPTHKRRIGMVFQDLALFPHLTAYQNIDFASRTIIKNKHDRKVWNTLLIEKMRIENNGNKYPSQLSGGEQQRIAIARALANKPKLLLLDEPFAQLDTELTIAIISDMEKLIIEIGSTVLLVSHHPVIDRFSKIDTQELKM